MSGEECDDHYLDVGAQRQFFKVVEWLTQITDPTFRVRVWQNGTGPGEYYEESVTEFFDDFSLEWLLSEGLSRLGMDEATVTAIRDFASRLDTFDKTLPRWSDAKLLEQNPGFQAILRHAALLLRKIQEARKDMRAIDDDEYVGWRPA